MDDGACLLGGGEPAAAGGGAALDGRGSGVVAVRRAAAWGRAAAVSRAARAGVGAAQCALGRQRPAGACACEEDEQDERDKVLSLGAGVKRELKFGWNKNNDKIKEKSAKWHFSVCTRFNNVNPTNPFCIMANERSPSLMMAKFPFSPSQHRAQLRGLTVQNTQQLISLNQVL